MASLAPASMRAASRAARGLETLLALRSLDAFAGCVRSANDLAKDEWHHEPRPASKGPRFRRGRMDSHVPDASGRASTIRVSLAKPQAGSNRWT